LFDNSLKDSWKSISICSLVSSIDIAVVKAQSNEPYGDYIWSIAL